MSTTSISVVIPVYNSKGTLDNLIQQLDEQLPGYCDNFECVLVNDGSTDGSWEEIVGLSQKFSWVVGINLMRNYGQHNALLCGIRAATKHVIVTIDDDFQHPPKEIPKLIAQLEKGYDVVYGTPLRQQHGFLRNFASYITRLALQSTMGVDIARKVSAFRAFKTKVREGFENFNSPSVTIDVLLTWGTSSFSSVEVEHLPRKDGKSNYTFSKLVRHALNMLTGFTVVPLQLASMLGFGFAIFGIFILFYVIGRFIVEGGSVPGFPFLASIIAIFSGVQLFSLGIIGEYIARMHFRLMEQPSYVERKRTDENAENEPLESSEM